MRCSNDRFNNQYNCVNSTDTIVRCTTSSFEVKRRKDPLLILFRLKCVFKVDYLTRKLDSSKFLTSRKKEGKILLQTVKILTVLLTRVLNLKKKSFYLFNL